MNTNCLLTSLPDTLLIKDTVEFYFENPEARAYDGFACRYLTSDGRKCAIGRMVPEECLNVLRNISGTVYSASVRSAIIEAVGDVQVDIELLGNLQRWHDNTSIAENYTSYSDEALARKVAKTQWSCATFIIEALHAAQSGGDVEIFIGTFEMPPNEEGWLKPLSDK